MHKVRFVVVCATLLAALTNAQTATLRYLSGGPRPRAYMAQRFDPRRIEAPVANMQMLDDPPAAHVAMDAEPHCVARR